MTTRHLLYSIYARRNNPEWMLNILELKKYCKLVNGYSQIFNGHISFIVRDDETTVDIDLVWNTLSEFKDSCIYCIQNNHEQGEVHGFSDYFFDLINKDGNTFYAHTKGVSRNDDMIDAIRTWRNEMYHACLSNVQLVDKVLKEYTCAGAFRIKGSWNQFPSAEWCYAGNFWWVNNDKLKKYNWKFIDKYAKRYAIEGYLGSIVPYEESYCLFEDEPKRNMYSIRKPPKIIMVCKNCKWDSITFSKCVYCQIEMEVKRNA